jgi:membrane protein YdbS with pleckstrin-like domain
MTVEKTLSVQNDQLVRIKPSLVPFTWKGFLVLVLGVILYVGTVLFQSLLPVPLFAFGSLVGLLFLGIACLGLLIILFGLVRRNMYTYQLTPSDLVIQKQFLGRSVRRIPFASISDVEVSQSFVGRLAGYGNIVPISKSGYGLVRGMERSENIVAEMTNIPHPDKVANMIMSRASLAPRP